LIFLDAVFSEEALSGGVGFEDDLDGVDLGDRHEGDLAVGAVGAAAGGGDLIVEAGEVFCDGHLAHFTGLRLLPIFGLLSVGEFSFEAGANREYICVTPHRPGRFESKSVC
jgi:hypothetical protein